MTMKRLILFSLIVGICLMSAFSVSFAADPPKPTCGKTVEDCQKQVDTANASLTTLQKQLQVYKSLLSEANDRLVSQAAR